MHRIIGKARRHPKLTALLVLVLAACVAGVAFAYFSASGSGDSASAAVANGSSVEIIPSIDSGPDFAPGVQRGVSVTINNDNDGGAYVGALSGVVHSSAPACDAAENFSLSLDPVNATISSHHGAQSSGTLQMLDLATSQDACQGSSVWVTVTSP